MNRWFFQSFLSSNFFRQYLIISLCAGLLGLTTSCATSNSEDEDEPLSESATEENHGTQPATANGSQVETSHATAQAPTGEGEVYYVRNDGISAYVGPSTSSAKLQSFKKGHRVQVLQLSNGWAQIKSGGYMEEAHISKAPVGLKKSSGTWHKKEKE